MAEIAPKWHTFYKKITGIDLSTKKQYLTLFNELISQKVGINPNHTSVRVAAYRYSQIIGIVGEYNKLAAARPPGKIQHVGLTIKNLDKEVLTPYLYARGLRLQKAIFSNGGSVKLVYKTNIIATLKNFTRSRGKNNVLKIDVVFYAAKNTQYLQEALSVYKKKHIVACTLAKYHNIPMVRGITIKQFQELLDLWAKSNDFWFDPTFVFHKDNASDNMTRAMEKIIQYSINKNKCEQPKQM